MELLKAMQEIMDAYQEETLAKMDANNEEIMAKMKAWRKEMKAGREARNATDLEANPEEKVSEAVHEEVPKEQAAVKPVGGLRKQQRGAESGCRAPLEAEGKDPGKLWIPEEIGLHRPEDDQPCRSGTAQGTCHQEESD
jgi:hypothetical protein